MSGTRAGGGVSEYVSPFWTRSRTALANANGVLDRALSVCARSYMRA